MAARRGLTLQDAKSRRLLTAGPGRLAQAMGLTLAMNGLDLCGPELYLTAGTPAAEEEIRETSRINVDYAGEWKDVPWRLLLRGSPYVSVRPREPVYIEESHAGSFYWVVENLVSDRGRRLLLVDRHSDATEIFNSDFIRQEVARQGQGGGLAARMSSWRERGVIQSFNWIEPLLPDYLGSIIWVAGASLSSGRIQSLQREAGAQINGHEEAAPRRCGDLSRCLVVTDLARLRKRAPLSGPVALSLDLDYFADCPAGQIEARMDDMLACVLALPGLEAVTVAVSTPYLTSTSQADLLLRTLLDRLTGAVNVRILYDSWAVTGPDRSRMARSYALQGRVLPRFRIEEATPALRSLILRSEGKIEIRDARWNSLRTAWMGRGVFLPRISVFAGGKELAPQGVCRFKRDDWPILRYSSGVGESPDRIYWAVLAPEARSYNIAGRNFGFADGAPRCLRFIEKPIPGTAGRLTIGRDRLRGLFDTATGCGTVRIRAVVEHDGLAYRTDPVCLIRCQDEYYPGRLSEIFNLPYVLGSPLIRAGGVYGPDAACGADCSGFVIYGRRRMGYDVPYVNPRQLQAYLAELDMVAGFRHGLAIGRRGPVRLDRGMIADGLLLHFGSHLVALYRDNPPLNVLDAGDLVAHQLEDYPRIMTLKDLRQARRGFRVMRFAKSASPRQLTAENVIE